jgi:hypothetical protein
MDGYLRIGFGDETAYLRAGLDRLHDLIEEVRLKPDHPYDPVSRGVRL